MVVLPSGDILVTEKGAGFTTDSIANVRLIRQGVLVADPVLTLSVNAFGDSGIHGIVLDPDFAHNHDFYLWYSVGKDGLAWRGFDQDRLSRFTYDPESGKADPLSEAIILDGVHWAPLHHGGALAFDANGNLFIGTGEAGNSQFAQDRTSLSGKLLRIHPRPEGGYDIPADNPFVGEMNNGSGVRAEIYAMGLRNPFRMKWRAADQGFYLVDVGESAWEEINRVQLAANYGWPIREGPCPIHLTDENCPPATPEFTNPVVTYRHSLDKGAGITALTFYTGPVWPAEYQGRLFFADYVAHTLSMVNLDDPLRSIVPFGNEIGRLVDLEAVEDGLYTLAVDEGVIRFIYYSTGGNQWPVAQMSVTPLHGSAPLTVEFSAAGSTDAENDPLAYIWNFGDGSEPAITTQPTISHTYTSDGDYAATLQVADAKAGKSETLTTIVQVYSGAMPMIVAEIVGEEWRQLYRGGDQVRFSIVRSGGNTGLDATTPYLWSIRQHHNQHVHFVLTNYASDHLVFDINDDSHAADVSLWYEVELTMRTAGGQQVRVTYELRPDVVQLNVQSVPDGAEFLWNGIPQPMHRPIAAIVGQRFTLETPSTLVYPRSVGVFSKWVISSTTGAGEVVVTDPAFEVLVAAEAKTFTAYYDYARPAFVTNLPFVGWTIPQVAKSARLLAFDACQVAFLDWRNVQPIRAGAVTRQQCRPDSYDLVGLNRLATFKLEAP
jgi:glucose/arabinose dehydrogenase/PKD repeat protein